MIGLGAYGLARPHHDPLPDHRFFTPTSEFWWLLQDFRDLHMLDLGTGRGDLPDEADERGFRMVGCDNMTREGQSERVIFMDALDFPVVENWFVLACRPNHSGWAEEALMQALRKGATVAYVGLERNIDIDLCELLELPHTRHEGVGEEDEFMLIWRPQ